MILLDTDVLIEIFDRESERGDEALEAILGSGEDFATTSINLHRRTDAMIAAIAINHGAHLYTFDLKHFKPLEDLGLSVFEPSSDRK